MRIFITTLKLFLFFLLLSNNVFAISPTAFRFKANLNTQGQKGALTFFIPATLLSEISNNQEFRIFDLKNMEKPFILYRGRPNAKNENKSNFQVIPFNTSFINGEFQSFEFEVPSQIKLLTKIELMINEQNYDRKVSILGKYKGEEKYQIIKEEMRLIQHYLPEQNTQFKHNILQFPPQKFNQYQVKISLPSNEKVLSINSISMNLNLESNENSSDLRENIPLNINPNIEEAIKEKIRWIFPAPSGASTTKTYYLLTPTILGVPLDQITLHLSGDNYTRMAQLFSLDNSDGKLKLERVSSGYLFKYSSETNTPWELSLPPTRAEKYLLIIDHGHNSPLPLYEAIGSLKKYTVQMSVNDSSPLTFYFGINPNQKEEPNYDLEVYFKRNPTLTFKEISIGQVQKNALYQESFSVEKKMPWLISITVILLVLGLSIYLRNLLKKTPI